MRISDHINNLNFSNELTAVNQLLSKAQGNITFWGKRVITISGYEGCISLDEIARKVLRVEDQCSEADDLTTEERVNGIEIIGKLRNIYNVTDTKITQKNWFTRLLNSVREFTFSPYTTRFFIGEMEYFRGYSENKFVQEFGGVKNEFGDYSNSGGSFGPPLRIIAHEKDIRAKLAH